METYGNILVIVTPLFLFLVLFEKWYGWYKGFETVETLDMISSLSSGVTNSTKDVLGLSVGILSYPWLVEHFNLIQVQSSVLLYLIAFMALDFSGYWVHRLNHTINIFWNNHLVHHSSEEFNLACALRQSISSFVNLFTFLLIPAALFGVPTKVIIITLPIQLFLQFWYHTVYINKLGLLEKFLVTPSHHRVHHAINPEYMDKNHSQIFIIWDKMFGTFQEELDSVPPVFGITRPAETWNPIRINFQHLGLLICDAWRAPNWKDKFTIWFKPTGWRPENFEEKYPVKKIKDVYNFQKFNSSNSKKLIYWSVLQALITLLLVSYLFNNIAFIGNKNVFIYGAFLFISIYSYTELMDTHKYSLFWEGFRLLFGVLIILNFGDWFGLNSFISFGSYVVLSYLVVSFLMTFYFVFIEFRKPLFATPTF